MVCFLLYFLCFFQVCIITRATDERPHQALEEIWCNGCDHTNWSSFKTSIFIKEVVYYLHFLWKNFKGMGRISTKWFFSHPNITSHNHHGNFRNQTVSGFYYDPQQCGVYNWHTVVMVTISCVEWCLQIFRCTDQSIPMTTQPSNPLFVILCIQHFHSSP